MNNTVRKRIELVNWCLHCDSPTTETVQHIRPALRGRPKPRPTGVVDYWEIAIKISVGKYTLNDDFETFMERQTVYSEFTLLPISVKPAAVVATLPFHHRDPFDRLLVAQAISEGIPIISADRALDSYSVTRMW